MPGRILIVFILVVWTFHWSGCLRDSKEDTASRVTYSFLDNARSADVITRRPDYIKFGQEAFTINHDKRAILFEHPDSEVVFKDVPVLENALLQFGIAINQDAWNKGGDGVLFEVRIVDERGHTTQIFSKYIDPKKNTEDRKWFDYNLDLQAFSGQKVSCVLKTTGGPEANLDYDWAGWSDPQLISTGEMGWMRRLWSALAG